MRVTSAELHRLNEIILLSFAIVVSLASCVSGQRVREVLPSTGFFQLPP
jgi:hypothetical protein